MTPLAQDDLPLIFCLHGNLQGPQVWEPFQNAFSIRTESEQSLPLKLASVALNQFSLDSFDAWANEFCAWVRSEAPGAPQFLLAYSLGGRLALHALLQDPSLWLGAIIIGADTGFEDERARAARVDADALWAERVLEMPLEQFFELWDAQPIFAGIKNPLPRDYTKFDRALGAKIFRNLSKGKQGNLIPQLRALERPPLLFLAGEEDPVFSSIGADLSRRVPALEFKSIPKAGHRVPWENPKDFVAEVQAFIYKRCLSFF